MKVHGYLIMHPGGDRPYFQHTPPTAYQKATGAKVFSFTIDVPGFLEVDGHIEATAAPAEGT